MAQAYKQLLRITPQACIGGAVLLLAVPFPWLSAWLISAAVHEVFHCGALLICGMTVESIQVGLTGAKIQTGALTASQTLFCALAGPGGGLLLLCLAQYFPRLAVCALAQSAFNLLPVYPLDGGRALRSILSILFAERTGNAVCTLISWFAAALIIILGAGIAFLWKFRLFPVLVIFLCLLYKGKIKIPCK